MEVRRRAQRKLGLEQSMNPDLAELLKKALELSTQARAALASSLLESLDDQSDATAEEAWNSRKLHEEWQNSTQAR